MILLSFLCLIASIVALNVPPLNLRDGKLLFDDFIRVYNKTYSSKVEKAKRYSIFLENLKNINDLNAIHEHAEFGITIFSDLTADEFSGRHSCVKFSNDTINDCREVRQKYTYHNDLEIPTEFDWRTKNVVTEVKNQGHCGSCWAFSVIGNVESVSAIKTGKLIDLSQQQLVDCDKADFGCNGGFPDQALMYLKQRGAMSYASYPYTGKDDNCVYDANQVVVKVKDCLKIGSGNEDFIAEQLVKIGPLSIALDGSGLQLYTKGVLHGAICKRSTISHAVLLVGYGTDDVTGLPYWLIKNSWGSERFGEEGYFRMHRGVNCLNLMGYSAYSADI